MSHMTYDLTMQVDLYGHDPRNGMLLNVFHVHSNDIIDEAVCDDVAALVADWANGNYNNCFAENVSTDRVVVTDVSAIDSFQSEVAVSAAGTLLGVAVPSQNTLALKKSTGRRGRSNRGDWYVWPATTAQLEILDANLFIESYRDTCVSEMNALITILNGGGYALVVASQATGLTRVVKSFVAVDRLVDSQNRRGGGRGR